MPTDAHLRYGHCSCRRQRYRRSRLLKRHATGFIAPARREGGSMLRFCPSVFCLSVAYIVNNSRTKSARKTKIGREIAQHTCDRHTSFKVKRSKFKVTRPIYTEQGLYILIDRPGSRHRHLAIQTLYYTSSSVLL